MHQVILCLLFFVSVANAQKPITHESLWMMKRVANPALSPDGKWVVYTLTEPSYVEGEQVADLWITGTAGGSTPKRLTFSKAAEAGAAWSPDAKRLAFAAKREGDEVNQIYVMDVAGGGEAVRLTTLSTGASSPVWSPDGRNILFSSRVYPGARNEDENKKAAAAQKALKYKARVYDSFPIRNWDKWLDDLQTHLFVQSVEPGSAARDLFSGTELVSRKGYAGVSNSGGDELQAAWTPDGQSVVFAATTNKTDGAHADTVTHLFQSPFGGGEPKALTSGKDGYTKPAFRPDGKALYALLDRNNGKIYNSTRLAMLAWPPAGAPTVVNTGADLSVGSFSFSSDSKRVFVSAEKDGLEKLFSLPADGGPAVDAVDTKSGVYTSVQASGSTVVALWSSAVNPAELVRVDLPAKRHELLTRVNVSKAAEIDWKPLRHFWFTSSKGRRIHNMVALPPNFDENKKYPLFVVIHGGPHTMWRDEITLRWNYHLLASPGYVVLLTNYTGSTGFGEKFAQEMQGDPLKGPGEEINEAADEAIKQFRFIDGSRQCAGGASYGGHMANWLQASTTRYRCLISHAGLINAESQWGTSDTIYHREVMAGGPVWEQGKVWKEQNPIRYAAKFKTPILLTVGENDFRVPLNQTLENWSVLHRLQIPSRLLVFPDANHWILKPEDSRFFFSEVHRWLAAYLK